MTTAALDDFFGGLERQLISVAGHETPLFIHRSPNPAAPTLLLIHGVGGSHGGLTPLAYELGAAYTCILVDLPGHGANATPPDRSRQFMLETWPRQLSRTLREQGYAIDRVIGHSFGCAIACALFAEQPRSTLLISPVPVPSAAYRWLGQAMWRQAGLVSSIYSAAWLANLRGMALCHKKTRQSWQLVKWVTKTTTTSRDQLLYQFELMSDVRAYDLPDDSRVTCIVAQNDSLPGPGTEQAIAALKNTCVVYCDGSHMLPIEDAPLAASIAKQEIVR